MSMSYPVQQCATKSRRKLRRPASSAVAHLPSTMHQLSPFKSSACKISDLFQIPSSSTTQQRGISILVCIHRWHPCTYIYPSRYHNVQQTSTQLQVYVAYNSRFNCNCESNRAKSWLVKALSVNSKHVRC